MKAVVLACCVGSGTANKEDLQDPGDGGRPQRKEDKPVGVELWWMLAALCLSAVVTWEILKWICRMEYAMWESRTTKRMNEPAVQEYGQEEPVPQPQEHIPQELIPQEPPPPASRRRTCTRSPVFRPPMPVHRPETDSEPATRTAVAPSEKSDVVPAGQAVRETAVVMMAAAGPPRPTLTPEDVEAVMYGDDIVWAIRDPGMLGRPPNPPLSVRSFWPLPFQPTVRDLRDGASAWGGEQSALHQLPPKEYEDHWDYPSGGRYFVVTRWHSTPRIQLFSPSYPGNRVDIRMLTGRRRTLATFQNGEQVILDDTWDRPMARSQLRGSRTWRGRTEFEVDFDAAEFVNDRMVFFHRY